MLQADLYKNVVSLGRACQPAHQIRRLFNDACPAHIFDWITTKDLGLVELIASDLNGFFARENIVWGEENCYIDRRNGTQFIHEFPSNADFDARYADYARKYDMLADRWRALMASREPTLFIRQHGWDADVRATAVRLRETLRAAAPSLPFTLLYLCQDAQHDTPWGERGIVNRHLVQPDPYVWTGDDSAWEHILSDALRAPIEAIRT